MKKYLLIFCLLISGEVLAATTTDFSKVVQNLKDLIDPLWFLLNSVMLMIGIALMFKGVNMLRNMGTAITQANKPGEALGPLVHLVIGAILLYLPYTANIFSHSLLGEGDDTVILADGRTSFTGTMENSNVESGSDLYAYISDDTLSDNWGSLVDTLFLYISLIGYFAFVRGWLIMVHIGQPGNQPGSIHKGIVHIIGGVAAINATTIIRVLDNTILGG